MIVGSDMDMDCRYGPMEPNMRATGKIMSPLAEDCSIILMGISMMVHNYLVL